MCFLILRHNVTKPHRVTSEPSEHSIAHRRSFVREFTVLDLIQIINKMGRLLVSQFESNLLTVRNQNDTDGYAATVDNNIESIDNNDISRKITVKTSPEVISMLEETMDWSVSQCLWPEARNCINLANKNMRQFLTSNFKVREFHPMIVTFDVTTIKPTELKDRLKTSLDQNDSNLFKKEKTTVDSGELGTQRRMDDRENRTTEEINSAIRDQMVSEIVNGQDIPSDPDQREENESNSRINDDERVADERNVSSNENSNESAKKVLDVLNMKLTDGFHCCSKKIVEAMEIMHMRKREKGSVDDTRRYNSLRGRWFGESNVANVRRACDTTIDRGSIIKTNIGRGAPYYLVYVVWRDNGSKKWFPATKEDKPSWPVTDSESKQFRLGIREVNISSEDGTQKVQMKDIVDGENVQKSVKMIKLREVKSFEFHISF